MSTHPPPRLFGVEGQPLNAVESRATRTALGLERRHVASLVNALQLLPDPIDKEKVTTWERLKEGGYPDAVAETLAILDAAVDRLSWRMAFYSGRHGVPFDADQTATHAGESVATLHRPAGSDRILAELHMDDFGVTLSPQALALIDQDGGAFWQALCDQAITRAALRLRVAGKEVRVVLDR